MVATETLFFPCRGQSISGFASRSQRIGKPPKVYQSSHVHVALRRLAPCRSIPDNGDFEAVFDEITQVRFCAKFAAIPARMTLSILFFRSWKIRSFVCGPAILCGEHTIVLPSSMHGVYSGIQSAPEPSKPSKERQSRRSNIRSLCMSVSPVAAKSQQ